MPANNCSKCFSTAPKGQPIALYLLTNRLTMVQGFTDDPEKLLKAAENLKPSRSHVLTTEAERQHTEGQIAYANSELTESAPSTSKNTAIMTEMTHGQTATVSGSGKLSDRRPRQFHFGSL